MLTTFLKSSKFECYDDYSVVPLRVWEDLSKKGDIKCLVISGSKRKIRKNIEKLIEAYDTISDQYIEELEIDMENNEIFTLTYKIIEANDRYINGDKKAKHFIRMYEKERDDLLKSIAKADYVGNRIAVSKWYGQKINPDETTLQEFCKMVKLMQEEVKQNGNSNEEKGI